MFALLREYISTYVLHLYGVTASDYLFFFFKCGQLTNYMYVHCTSSGTTVIVNKLKKQTTPNYWTMLLLVCNFPF